MLLLFYIFLSISPDQQITCPIFLLFFQMADNYLYDNEDSEDEREDEEEGEYIVALLH